MPITECAPRALLMTAVLCVVLPGCAEDDQPTRLRNDPPTACFTVDPSSGTTETSFSFDATCSHDAQDSTGALQVRWDWDDDGGWDTEWTAEKTATHPYSSAGRIAVRLEVRDTRGLTGVALDSVLVEVPNGPPMACFMVSPAQGTAETRFALDAACSADAEDPLDSLGVRWDWENDGVWDTEWIRDKDTTRVYPTIGLKVVRLEVRDTGGLTDAVLESLEVAIDYLGRPEPDLSPRLFPPTSLRAAGSWMWHGVPAFSPNGLEMFFTKYVHTSPHDYSQLVFLRLEDGHWSSQPQPAPFSDTNYFENNPWYSASGDTLYYVSSSLGGFIVFVTRLGDGWSQPQPLSVEVPGGMTTGLQFSISRDGTLYAELWEGADSNIYRWERLGDSYVQPENLGEPINSSALDFMPFIDPEEQFLLFCSKRPGGYGMTDIYISRSAGGGAWGDPVNLGPQVNSAREDGWPAISPDGKYLFFNSDRAPGARGYEPHWVDVHYLDGLGF
jgi:PKD repeat protein